MASPTFNHVAESERQRTRDLPRQHNRSIPGHWVVDTVQETMGSEGKALSGRHTRCRRERAPFIHHARADMKSPMCGKPVQV